MSHAKLVVFAALLAIGACSSEPEPEQAGVSRPSKPQQGPKSAEDEPLDKMARAVGGSGKPVAAVDLRYDILAKPEVGRPIEIKLALVPGSGVNSMTVTVGGMEGITLSGPLEASFPQVEAGTPYEHTFSVLPDRAGVYYVTVSVNCKMRGGTTMGRTFSIPFAVGEVQAQQKATQSAKDASGQPIEPMKAEETSSR